MAKVMTKERVEQLRQVYNYAKEFPDESYSYILTLCNTSGGSTGVFIKGARGGSTFDECMKKYRTYNRRNICKSTLSNYTDIQLKQELEARGWTVTCKRTTIEEL